MTPVANFIKRKEVSILCILLQKLEEEIREMMDMLANSVGENSFTMYTHQVIMLYTLNSLQLYVNYTSVKLEKNQSTNQYPL